MKQLPLVPPVPPLFALLLLTLPLLGPERKVDDQHRAD
jgi:hypothetical protein